MQPASPEAYQLLHDGALAFAEIERAGMRVDVAYLDATIEKQTERIKVLNARLKEDPIYKTWKKTFGAKANIDSASQLGTVLFDVLKCEGGEKTGGEKQWKTDKSALEHIDLPFVKHYFQVKSLKKLRSTYLLGVRREVEGEFVHHMLNLHTVMTYRSSGSNPNSQNIPSRDGKLAKLIRTAFIPRDGHVLLELDLKANEVRMAGCYCKDKRLIKDTLEGDMHRDMAAELFLLPVSAVPGDVRQTAKNKFVFAEFYGDFYPKVATNLWEDIARYGLKTKDDISLEEHLASKGIHRLGRCDPKQPARPGTYEYHVQEVERRFWKERYTVYDRWRRRLWDQYLEDGYVRYKTGFVVQGIYSKNQILNAPIQGSAFHCLLWALIRLVKWLKKHKMKSRVITQIHDSALIDAHKSEWRIVAEKFIELLVVDIRKAWPWIIMPLGVECGLAETNWYEKVKVEL